MAFVRVWRDELRRLEVAKPVDMVVVVVIVGVSRQPKTVPGSGTEKLSGDRIQAAPHRPRLEDWSTTTSRVRLRERDRSWLGCGDVKMRGVGGGGGGRVVADDPARYGRALQPHRIGPLMSPTLCLACSAWHTLLGINRARCPS